MKEELRELPKTSKNTPILSDEDIHALFNALDPDRQSMGPVRRKLSELRGSFEHYINNQKMKRLTKAAQKNIIKPEFLTHEEIDNLLDAVGKDDGREM